jgi:type IV pilus assembly protein PilE
MNSRRARGFTLIELMVVVMVIAVLSAIAIPSYLEQSRKGRRADAMRAVSEYQLAMERWRSENPCYGQSGGSCPTFTASGTYPAAPTSDSGFYTFTLGTATPTAYSVTATPAGRQSGDRCGNLVLNWSAGSGKPTWSGDADCNN